MKKVLLVDDNPLYRQSVKRNLEMHKYKVYEAEDASEALKLLNQVQTKSHTQVDAVITDLALRTPREGISLISEVRKRYPTLPVILISAVGTFDDGALAKECGATYVVSKNRLGGEKGFLIKLLEKAISSVETERELFKKIEYWQRNIDSIPREEVLTKIHNIIVDSSYSSQLKSEAFELLTQLQSSVYSEESKKQVAELPAFNLEIQQTIAAQLANYPNLTDEAVESLRIAEFLHKYQQMLLQKTGEDNKKETTIGNFSRNICFSYCFAVEKEMQSRVKYKVARMLKSATIKELLSYMYDEKLKNLDLAFQRYLFLLEQSKGLDFQIDKIKLVLERMIELGESFRPDGLKTLGVLVLCFGRNYSFTNLEGITVEITNPLGLKGLSNEDEVLHLAALLIRLQHFRNPYIHPEIAIHEKITIIREATLECLKYISKLE